LAAAAATPWDFLQLSPISDGVATTDDRGWAGVHINAVSFKTEALTTVGDYQFTSYYGADGKLIVGRRNLATNPGTWDLLRTQFTSFNINDAHNTSSIAIDGDGYLHMAWGVHGNPLPYTRSTTPVLNDAPFSLVGDTVGNSGSIAGALPLQSSGITYPQFWNIPDSGDLFLTYRIGSSGNGEWQLARWNNASNTWLSVHTAVNSTDASPVQPWIDNDYGGDSLPNVNAYHNGLAFDSMGKMHLSWTWRTGGDSTSGFTDYQSNHNIMYAASPDLGVNWYRDNGTIYQRNGIHDIDESNAAPVVSIPEGSSLINQDFSTIGPNDHYYMATYWAPQAAQGNHLRQIMLVEYDGAQWKSHQVTHRNSEYGNIRIPESQLRNFPLRRPVVMTDADDRVFVVYGDYQRGGGVTLAYSEQASRDDWAFIDLTSDNLGTWSPTFDRNRWTNDGVLSMYYQPMGLGPAAATVSVLEWDARAYFATNPPPPPPPPPPMLPPAVVAFHASFDSPTVPANWVAQNGSSGTAVLGIVDDDGGIDSGNALSINAATRQGVIGEFERLSFVNVGDKIELSFDARLTQYANNSGGFRFGLYEDHDGAALSSGYRVLVGTGSNAPRTDVQADGGDTADGDIAFGTNRENPPGFSHQINGIDDTSAHSFLMSLTRTAGGVLINLLQDGVASLAVPVLHVPGTGTGVATPLQLSFNQVVFTTNGGMLALIDNVQVAYLPRYWPGDFNRDDVVDAADYVLWRKGVGTTFSTSDYEVWRRNFGARSSSAAAAAGAFAAVPEPSIVSVVVAGVIGLATRTSRTLAAILSNRRVIA
jgi:hypothetical protein